MANRHVWDHPLGRGRGSAIFGLLSAFGIGVGLITFALQARSAAFWIGAVICLGSAVATFFILWTVPKRNAAWVLAAIAVPTAEVLVVVTILLAPAGSQGVKLETSPDARKELANDGVSWSEDNFAKAIASGDERSVVLFLRGGMSPNAVGSDVFAAESIVKDQTGNAEATIKALQHYGFNPSIRLSARDAYGDGDMNDLIQSDACAPSAGSMEPLLVRSGLDPTRLIQEAKQEISKAQADEARFAAREHISVGDALKRGMPGMMASNMNELEYAAQLSCLSKR